MSPSNSFKCPLSLKGNTSGFVSLLKGLLCLSLTCLVEYNNTLELSLTLFQPISFSHFRRTVVLLVNSHHCSWPKSVVSQTLQRWAFRSVTAELVALSYWENESIALLFVVIPAQGALGDLPRLMDGGGFGCQDSGPAQSRCCRGWPFLRCEPGRDSQTP